MKNFISKQATGFYAGIVAVIFMLIGTIILSANGTMPYYNDFNAAVLLLGILAVLIAAALLTAAQFLKVPHLEVLWIVVIVLMTAALMMMFSMRVESMAYILGSDLENDNPLARPALNNFFAGAVISAIGILAAVVAAFCDVTKKNIEKAA